MSTALEAALVVVSGLVSFIKTHGCRKASADVGANVAVHASKYKISVCRDLAVKGTCPRGISCTFAHSEEELVKLVCSHKLDTNDELIRPSTNRKVFLQFCTFSLFADIVQNTGNSSAKKAIPHHLF